MRWRVVRDVGVDFRRQTRGLGDSFEATEEEVKSIRAGIVPEDEWMKTVTSGSPAPKVVTKTSVPSSWIEDDEGGK